MAHMIDTPNDYIDRQGKRFGVYVVMFIFFVLGLYSFYAGHYMFGIVFLLICLFMYGLTKLGIGIWRKF